MPASAPEGAILAVSTHSPPSRVYTCTAPGRFAGRGNAPTSPGWPTNSSPSWKTTLAAKAPAETAGLEDGVD